MEEEDDRRWGWTEGMAFRRYARKKHRRLGIEGEDGSFNLKQVNKIYYIKKGCKYIESDIDGIERQQNIV